MASLARQAVDGRVELAFGGCPSPHLFIGGDTTASYSSVFVSWKCPLGLISPTHTSSDVYYMGLSFLQKLEYSFSK